MYGTTIGDSTVELERTAFRKAEKKYKLYKSLPSNPKPKHRRQSPAATDLSDVVDFSSILASHCRGEELPRGIHTFPCPGFSHPVFCFRDHPGFYFIPGALSIEEQCHWVRESLTNFPQPPNRSNHTAIYGPLYDLFAAVQSQKFLVESERPVIDVGLAQGNDGGNIPARRYIFSEVSSGGADNGPARPIPAATLLRKLRWSTLGLQFDWSKRNYDISLPHNKIPDALCFLAKKMAAPAMPPGEVFWPEAAIVNYFGPSDMLGGHLDDMEADWSKPIVSISLGCKAIFLLGGKSREDTPVSMFLRSGDIVLMAGQARECFHGVPRIFTDEENADVHPLLSKLSEDSNPTFKEYMKTSRINVNIRQVN